MTYEMPCHTTGHQVLPTQHLASMASIVRGGKYVKDVTLPTFLAYLQPVKLTILD